MNPTPASPHPLSNANPFSAPGRYLVSTASGSRHLIDSSDADRAVEVVRMPDLDPANIAEEGFAAAGLRRDAEWLPIIELGWIDADNSGQGTGIRVGADLVMVLNLRGDGIPTVRRTTPVRSITLLRGSDGDRNLTDVDGQHAPTLSGDSSS